MAIVFTETLSDCYFCYLEIKTILPKWEKMSVPLVQLIEQLICSEQGLIFEVYETG